MWSAKSTVECRWNPRVPTEMARWASGPGGLVQARDWVAGEQARAGPRAAWLAGGSSSPIFYTKMFSYLSVLF